MKLSENLVQQCKYGQVQCCAGVSLYMFKYVIHHHITWTHSCVHYDNPLYPLQYERCTSINCRLYSYVEIYSVATRVWQSYGSISIPDKRNKLEHPLLA